MKYSVDTSTFIKSWTEYYPIDIFQTFWKNIESLCSDQILVSPEEVLRELKVQEKDTLYKWAKTKESLQYPLDVKLQEAVREVIDSCPSLVNVYKQRSGADPFVIALAKITNATVVSEEKPRKSSSDPLKIPDACQLMGIKHFRVADLIREQGWTF